MDINISFRQSVLDAIDEDFNSLIDSIDMSDHAATFNIAVHYQRYDMAKEMISRGVVVNSDNSRALYHAVANKNDEFVDLLIQKGCDATANNSIALSAACRLDYTHGIRALLNAGADKNASNLLYKFTEPKTPIEILISNVDTLNIKDNLKLLLTAGANVSMACREYILNNDNLKELVDLFQ